ncbi:unnamed protein product [Malus baccata var. baccata]
MKSPKLLNHQTLKTLQAPTHFPQKPPPSAAPLSSLAHPTSPLPITHHTLLTSSQSSQWYFIKQISPNIPPSLIFDALFDLRKSPELFLKFISQIEFHRLDVDIRCLAIAIVAQPSPKRSFDLEANERLSEKSSIEFDLLVQACCEMKKADEALECFYLMKDKGRLKKATEFLGFMETLGIQPNVVTYNTIIHGYCSIGRVGRAQMLFSALKDKGVELDSYMYVACARKEDLRLFNKMLEIGLVSTIVTYNTLIDGYCNKGDLDKAFGYRDEMVKKGVLPTVSTYNLLIHALLMEGKMVEVDDMVKEMKDKGMDPDAITYNILINGYCRSGIAKKAFSLRDEMLSKWIEPTNVTYTSLIYVLSKRKRMQDVDDLFKKLLRKGVLPDLVMFNALIDGHCANSTMECVFALLEAMDKMKVHPDGVTYNTLMQGCCREGKVKEARQLMEEMKRRGIKPIHISFITLISGYSKRSDLNDALKLFFKVAGLCTWDSCYGFLGCTCLKFPGKCIPREVSIEYEQLQSRGADVPIAINDFKEVHPYKTW